MMPKKIAEAMALVALTGAPVAVSRSDPSAPSTTEAAASNNEPATG